MKRRTFLWAGTALLATACASRGQPVTSRGQFVFFPPQRLDADTIQVRFTDVLTGAQGVVDFNNDGVLRKGNLTGPNFELTLAHLGESPFPVTESTVRIRYPKGVIYAKFTIDPGARQDGKIPSFIKVEAITIAHGAQQAMGQRVPPEPAPRSLEQISKEKPSGALDPDNHIVAHVDAGQGFSIEAAGGNPTVRGHGHIAIVGYGDFCAISSQVGWVGPEAFVYANGQMRVPVVESLRIESRSSDGTLAVEIENHSPFPRNDLVLPGDAIWFMTPHHAILIDLDEAGAAAARADAQRLGTQAQLKREGTDVCRS